MTAMDAATMHADEVETDVALVRRLLVGTDGASWPRGRGWALCQAVLALPYYWDTNPGMVRQASRALAHVLADSAP
jgi:hypothetical protein